jgi:hypothetical protein
LNHGQFIIHQHNFGHRAEPNSTHSAGQASFWFDVTPCDLGQFMKSVKPSGFVAICQANSFCNIAFSGCASLIFAANL